VLLVVTVLTLASLTFSQLMLTERRAADAATQQSQARAAAESGIEAARVFLAQPVEDIELTGGWYDNPDVFQAAMITDSEDARHRSRFSLVAPVMDEGGVVGIRFGVEDESTRLNLNALLALDKVRRNTGRDLLMGLPGMTEEIADAILDWMDEDDETREFGAEVDYYSGLEPAYAPKNGPLETVEELLLVRDVTPELLFGVDANRNGLPDANELPPEMLSGVDNSDGSMTRGWSAYLTLYSLEKNTRADGSKRIDLNQSDLQKLHDEIADATGNEELAVFTVAYRQAGRYKGKDKSQPIGRRRVDFKKKGKTKLRSVLDLAGVKVQMQFVGEKNAIVVDSPIPDSPMDGGELISLLMENTTVNPAEVIPGRININQAPRAMLEGIPGMEPDIVEAIISQRIMDPIEAEEDRIHETWIWSEGIVSLSQMRRLLPFVNAGGGVYRVQSVGYFDGTGPAARLEAVIDTTESPPRVILWRDLTHLGRGYPAEMLGVGLAEGF
ncbi:MAG: hypothetical protein ACOY3P_05015, partial [Planctomycetota bacterium]